MSSNGTVVANYYYGAYGEILSITDADGEAITDALSVAFLNPLRYRGYVYDNDTGFYYLQSRYYDPIIKRFINADDAEYLGASGNVVSYNLFSYGDNNPINKVDFKGHYAISLSAILIIGVAITVIVAVAVSFLISNIKTKYNSKVASRVKERIRNKLMNFHMLFTMVMALAEFTAKKSYKKPFEYHHIVPKSSKVGKAPEVRKIYLKSDYSLNNPINIIILKTGFHRRLNSKKYYEFLYGVFEICCSNKSGTELKYGVLMALGISRHILSLASSIAPI